MINQANNAESCMMNNLSVPSIFISTSTRHTRQCRRDILREHIAEKATHLVPKVTDSAILPAVGSVPLADDLFRSFRHKDTLLTQRVH